MAAPFTTDITKLFGIQHPILLAGMNVAAGPELAAAVTNAGGLGVIGGVGYTPKFLREQLSELKSYLNDKSAPFGVDLLLPQVGGNARKTNKDYTEGKLDELVDIIIEEGAKVFVSAVGVPPKYVVDRLHKAGIPVMNMIGHVKHIEKALSVGVDIICAQGGEGGGHTGDIPTSVLIPECVEILKNKYSPFLNSRVPLVAAGGIYNGKGLAAVLTMGASAVWVGTRFVASEEAGAPKYHQDAVVNAQHGETLRTIIYTGRPLRLRNTEYVHNWETKRKDEIKTLTNKGIVPITTEDEDAVDPPLLMGSDSGAIKDVKPAKVIIDDMLKEAVLCIKSANNLINPNSKL